MTPTDIQEIVQRARQAGFEPHLRGKRVLVSGARGFLGRHFVAALSALGARVAAVDSWAWGAELRVQRHTPLVNVDYVNADITAPPPTLIAGGHIDYILALAGIASPVWYKKHPIETFDVSVKGVRAMLDIALAQGSRLLFSSSSEVYGDPAVVPTPESYRGNVSCRGDRACYDEGKRAAETLCDVYHRYWSVDARTVRYFNVYGPGLSQYDYRVLPTFVQKILKGERLGIYGTGVQTRTFCYVTDAVFGTLRVLLDGEAGGVYNVGNESPEVSIIDLVTQLERLACRDMEQFHPVYVPSPPEYADEPQRRCPDLTRLRALGYAPLVGFEEGLGRFLAWARTAYAEGE